MNSIKGAGYLALIGGTGTLGFQTLSTLMQKDNVWHHMTLGGVAGKWADTLMAYIPAGFLQDNAQYLVNDLPLYQLLLCLGIMLVLVGSFLRR